MDKVKRITRCYFLSIYFISKVYYDTIIHKRFRVSFMNISDAFVCIMINYFLRIHKLSFFLMPNFHWHKRPLTIFVSCFWREYRYCMQGIVLLMAIKLNLNIFPKTLVYV